MKNRFVTFSTFLVWFLAASFALAAPSFAERREAQKLAREGKALVQKKKWKKAAKKFKKADNLNPAPSYKLSMAKMLIELDDLVQAGDVLSEAAASTPRQWQEKKAVKDAQKLLEEVEELIPTIEVTIVEPTDDEVTVQIDGEDFEVSDGAVSYNPGRYEVTATAPGYKAFNKSVTLQEGDQKEVTVSLLSAGPAEDAEEGSTGDGFGRMPAYIGWGVGVVGLGVGIGFGVAAITTTNEVLILYECQSGQCPREAEADLDRAKLNGNLSTAGFVIGLAGLGAGTVLFFLADEDDADTVDEGDDSADEGMLRIDAKPLVGPGYLGVTGSF